MTLASPLVMRKYDRLSPPARYADAATVAAMTVRKFVAMMAVMTSLTTTALPAVVAGAAAVVVAAVAVAAAKMQAGMALPTLASATRPTVLPTAA